MRSHPPPASARQLGPELVSHTQPVPYASCRGLTARSTRPTLRLALVLALLIGAGRPAATAAEPAAAAVATRFDFASTPGHLSKEVRPLRSRIELDLDPARPDFDGTVAIDLQIAQPRPDIELHAVGLSAGSARLIDAQGRSRALRVLAQPASQTWRLVPLDGAPVAPGSARLEITYRGTVQQVGQGLYVVPYRVAGQLRRMLATQLQAIHARSVFPAFDEPAFKTVFELSVRAPRGDDVVSNMPRLRLVPGGPGGPGGSGQGLTQWHHFAPTPPMSSYLLSVAVGRFEALSASAAQVPLRILVAEGRREQAHEALRATRQVLPWYADYFGQPYALPKLDQLAVPGVRSGAMEDWGLVSYAEDLLLFDPARSDSQTQREVYQTVAHELAHQWFGNLVTAASWDELWLNEAFATWLQDKATDRFNPAWQIPLRARPLLDRAMALDSGAASRAIRAAPVRESAVNDVFDEITYAKGGALLGMIEQWLGPATLRQGLVAYMQAQRLSSATAADLWHHIGQAAAQAGATVDVAAMAASWTDQAGFPLVEASSRCVDGQARLSLRQSRFSLGLPGAAALPEALWQVPVQIEQGGKRRTVLLDQAEQGVELGACSDTPTLVNAGGLGFYRVAHDAPTQQALIRRYAGLTGADRVALLSDSEALLQAGRQDLPAHLALLDAVARIDDASQPLLWAQLRRQLEDIDTLLGEHPARALWRALGRRLAEPALARLGWSAAAGEAADLTELRSTLITLLVRFEHGPSISQALRAFDADASGRRRLPPALREPVLRAAGMWGERAQVELLRARLNASDNEEDRWLYARALAGGRDPARAAELLLASLGDLAPPHVASELPGLIARNSPFGAAAYDFTLAHWAELARRSDDWGRVGLLPAAAAGFCEPAQAERLLADQRRLAGADGDSAAQRQAAAIRLRAAVRERVAAALMPTPVASPVVSPAASPASR